MANPLPTLPLTFADMTEFKMPSLGADMAAGTLREWRKKPGDAVHRGDIIAEVETQKGIIEVEVFTDGVVGKLLLEIDKKVPVGTPMALIMTEVEWHATKTPAIAEPVKATARSAEPAHHLRISPLARKVAETKGIDIGLLTGTGPEGAITMKDLESIPAVVSVPVISGMRAAVAAAMERSKREIPHYYLSSVMDLHAMTTYLTEKNRIVPPEKRILPTAVFIRAVALALKQYPDLNGWWKEKGLVRAEGIHIGIAISLKGGGLVNPAICDAEQLTLEKTMEHLSDLITRARGGALKSSEFSSGTFTLSSIGTEGADALFGVIQPPQVGLAGFGPIRETVLAVNGMVAIRPAATVTLSADHRATDGIYGSRFMLAVSQFLQQPGLW